VEGLLSKQNTEKPYEIRIPDISANFVSKNAKVEDKRSTSTRIKFVDATQRVFCEANDWALMMDFDHKRISLPVDIYVTDQRPDIIIISRSTKVVILVELTCPVEENIEAAAIRKEAKYHQLCEDINSDKKTNWKCHLMTIEAGSRGFIAKSMYKFIRTLNASGRYASQTCKHISRVVQRCSYSIYTHRANPFWDAKRPLLSLNNNSGEEEQQSL
jgi:hypothetical protein